MGGCCKGVWPGPPFKKPRRASDRTRILCPREVVSGSVNGVSGLLAAMICCYSCWFIGVYCVYMIWVGVSAIPNNVDNAEVGMGGAVVEV